MTRLPALGSSARDPRDLLSLVSPAGETRVEKYQRDNASKLKIIMKKIFIWIALIGFIIFIGLAGFTFSKIYHSVERITDIAKNEFEGNAIESLIELVNSKNHSIREKNTAIWALGQIADEKALPFLEKINSETNQNSPCNLSNTICKGEIEKAIKWCKKGNLTSWMYRKIK